LNSRYSLLSFIVAACLSSACANQVYHSKAIEAEKTADQFAARSLNSPELQRYMQSQGYPAEALPVSTWGLRELTLAAFFYHPQLAVARAQWQAARAQEVTAGQKPNPSISGDIEHHSKTDGGVSPWTLGISLDIPIETGDKRQIRIDQAVNLSQAVRIDIGQQAWQVRSRLQASLIEYRATLDQSGLLQREVDLQAAIVQMLQKRLEAGIVSDIDLATARLQLQKLQNSLATETARSSELRAELAIAVGIPVRALDAIKIDDRLPALYLIPKLPPADMQRAALLNRLDIRSALARYDAAESRLKLEIAKQHPDFVLSPGYIFDQGDNLWSLGVSLLLGLSNKNEGPIAEAEAMRELEARQFEALQARVIGEQEQALAQYASRLAELDKAESVVAAQQRQNAKSERLFKAGHIDRLEWTTTQLEALLAEQGRLAAMIRVYKALAALEDALQRPLDDGQPLALPQQNSEDIQS
jgi:cobalt-zinc-cadmium efflux system outer membrane protein